MNVLKELLCWLHRESTTIEHPQYWSYISSVALVIPFSNPEDPAIAINMNVARSIKNELFAVLRRKLPDEVFNEIEQRKKRQTSFSQEEAKYYDQVLSSYNEMLREKVQIVLVYEGDWSALSLEEWIKKDEAVLSAFRAQYDSWDRLITPRFCIGEGRLSRSSWALWKRITHHRVLVLSYRCPVSSEEMQRLMGEILNSTAGILRDHLTTI